MQPRTRSIDGFARTMPATDAPEARQRPSTAVRQPVPRPAPPPELQPQRRSFEAPAKFQPRRRFWQRLAFPAAIMLCLSGSFLVQSLPLGMAAIALYALIAWLKRLPSRYSFIMAFLSLATVIILLVVRQNVDLASNFSTYTFLLLVVGIVSVMFESRAYPKRRNSKIPNLRRRLRLW